MSASIDNPVPERPRLGDLLVSAGLLTSEQLEASLVAARAAGKPLGHILVEQGLVSPHSIAMALADQHGGPLKSEFGFATGRSGTPPAAHIPDGPPSAPPVLRLAPVQPDVHLEPPIVAGTPEAPSPESVTITTAVADEQHEAESARRSAEARADELLTRVEELEAANEESLATMRAELATAVATHAALRSQLAAERELREQDARTVEAWRAELEGARAQNDEAAKAAASLRAQLDELLARDEAPPAVAEAEELLGAVRAELAAALAESEELRVQLAAEHAANQRAATATDTLTAEIEELRGQRAADAAAVAAREASLAEARDELVDAEALRVTIADERTKSSAAEEALAAIREDLATALADAVAVRSTLAAEREAHQDATATADVLRARIAALETAAQEAEAASVVVPEDEDVDHLRAVIELQEQALAAAAARERARDGDARVVADRPSTRPYSDDAHFLFAPSADGYELLERSGPSPAPGDVVELSGDRTCRVLRVGPAPFPGAPERCAYLELV